MSYLFLLLGLIVIFIASEVFTNAVEWFGRRLNMSEGAVGGFLAAVGTALPETTVAIVAATKDGGHTEVAIGAILGAPMMLATLAMFLTGAAVFVFARMKIRPKDLLVDKRVVATDLKWFLVIYIIAFSASLVPENIPGFQTITLFGRELVPGKVVIAVCLVGIYSRYVKYLLGCQECLAEDETRPLHFAKKAEKPPLFAVVVQLAAGVALIIIGANLFVENVKNISQALGVAPLVLAVIITPIATELPEKFNSITWMKYRKDPLALGNVTGAMVFQSSILPSVGLIFTPWRLETNAMASVAIAIGSALAILLLVSLKKRVTAKMLLVGGVFYAMYPLFVFVIRPALLK